MSDLSISIQEARTAFEPGDEVSGNVSWNLSQAPRGIELRLFWFTRGKGTEDAAVVQTLNFERPMETETRSFRFRLPNEPYSFSGTLISLIWALELVAQPGKEVCRSEIVVAPGGKEISLGSLPNQKKRGITWTVRT